MIQDKKPMSKKIRHRSLDSKASPARIAALDCLIEITERDAFAKDLLNKRLSEIKMSPSDKAFARKLVLGVVQMRGTLDEVIDMALRSPNDIKQDVRCSLEISTFEMLFLDKDAYVSVNQGVELVKYIAPNAQRLANAVLRKIARLSDDFPFGDTEKDIEAYLRLHGFPYWLGFGLIRRNGILDTDNFLKASNEPAPLYIAVNSLKATDEEISELVHEVNKGLDDPDVNRLLVDGCFRIFDPVKINDGRVKQALNKKKIFAADASSQQVAHLCAKYSDGMSFLEIGSGRGTKTLLIQSDYHRMHGCQIKEYVTVDKFSFKTKLLSDRALEHGINVSKAITADATNLGKVLEDSEFQCVFIDTPCSGLGTLRRHPEIRWKLRFEDLNRFANRDMDLLNEAARFVQKDGFLIYATCTVVYMENEEVVARFLSEDIGKEFKLIDAFKSKLVPDGPDAHFCAVLKRG